MERNENNGRGIFYGVIGVATLVVAIIGATFAYFTARAGTETPFNTSAANITLQWDEEDYYQSNLIPIETGFADTAQTDLDADAAAGKFAKSASVGNAVCKDINDNSICSMYQFQIINPSTSTANQQVYASLTASTNGIENLKFAVFSGTPQEIFATTEGWNVNGDAGEGNLVIPATALNGTGTTQLTALNQVLDPGDNPVYTIVLWIEEIGAEQKQGGSFTGRIDFTTGTGQGVTGVLAA